MVALKSNCDRRILLILIPLLFAHLLYTAFKTLTQMSSSNAFRLDAILAPLVIGIAMLWLLAPKLAGTGGFVRFLLSLCLLAGLAFLGTLSVGSGDRMEIVLIFLLSLFIGAVLLAGAAAAGRLCRWRYRPGVFLLWLGLCVVMGHAAAMCVFFVVVVTGTSGGSPEFWIALPQVAFMGLLMGLCVYIFNLPFMVLGFAHPFFRDRLQACLNLRPAGDATSHEPGPSQPAPGSAHSEPAPPRSS